MNQEVTLFEILPNEILIESFKYLNGVDILHSFDRLNYRFHSLIYGLSLYVNFHNVKKFVFDEFCSKIISYPNIKNQIYSLQLSNTTNCQIHHFLNLFLLTDFINLRSLTLIEVGEHNISQLKSLLPSLNQVICIRLIDYEHSYDQLLLPQLQILQTPFLFSKNDLLYDISIVQSLTIFSCSIMQLNQILLYALKLEYLKIEYISAQQYNRTLFKTNRATHIRKLIFIEFSDNFSELTFILKQTPNLGYLTVCTQMSGSLYDPKQWQDLIESSLPNLRTFNFKFEQYCISMQDDIQEKCAGFQTDFWQKEHQWYIRCVLTENLIYIYSIPYISNQFFLAFNKYTYENEKMVSKNEFNKVHHLIIDPHQIKNECQHYFSNLTTLQIGDSLLFDEQTVISETHVQYLPKIVNLNNIKTLSIGLNCKKIQTSSVLLTIFEQTPNLSFLGIEPNLLVSLMYDENLCKYLKKMIESLDLIVPSNANVIDLYEMNSIWTTFSDITYLRCRLSGQRSIIFLIEQLPKLLRLDFKIGVNTILSSLFYFEKDIQKKFDIKIISDSRYKYELEFFNWIIRNNK